MRKVLLLNAHFPPSNLAGVHRTRLFAQHLSSFNWEPVILTVHEKYYEEEPDWNLVSLLPHALRVEKVKAFRITKPRLIGDIGLRAFLQLYQKAKQLIIKEKIEFIYISIPSFYCALLGRWLHSSTGISYGIDYIDPWVHDFPGSNQVFSRHWFAKKLADFLEPVAIKKASLITGVAAGYYTAVLERNPHLKKSAVIGAMPYGGEKQDHVLLNTLNIKPYLFSKNDKFQIVYAGAMMPKSYKPLEAVFKSMANNPLLFSNTIFHFIGTGKTPDDGDGYNIKALAKKYGLWQKIIFEYPKRIPYLDVLVHLNAADGIFILGSTEPHYTPSKTYQAVLSEKPVMALLHQDSTAVQVIRDSCAGLVYSFNGENGVNSISDHFHQFFPEYISFIKSYDCKNVNMKLFEKYSAKNVTGALALLLEKALRNSKPHIIE